MATGQNYSMISLSYGNLKALNFFFSCEEVVNWLKMVQCKFYAYLGTTRNAICGPILDDTMGTNTIESKALRDNGFEI